ncbi:MAG: glycosyltransferase family 4 protein [Chloroflexota bacterium]
MTTPSKTPSNKFATTVYWGFYDRRFSERAINIPVPETLEKIPRSKFNLRSEWRLLWGTLQAAWQENALLVFSSRGFIKPELIATIIIGFWPKRIRPIVVFFGEMYQPNIGIRKTFDQIAMKLGNRAVKLYVVYSHEDRASFAMNWGIDPKKIRICPYFTYHTQDDELPSITEKGEHIFSGGNSFRDYEPLIDAARMIPDKEFYICTTKIIPSENHPPNVHIGPVPFKEYQRLISTAAVVVVPLKTNLKRSTGMLTYLEAMWSKKPTIVTEAHGVREYITNNETGILVDGTPQAYVDAIRWILNPKNQNRIKKITDQAHKVVMDEFTLEKHVTKLLEIMDEAMCIETNDP